MPRLEVADVEAAQRTSHSELHANSARYVWYVIALLTVVNVFSYMDRMALSVLAPRIKADLHLSDTQLGLLTGLAFSLFYAACGIPIARWADRGVRKNIIALALSAWSVMTALSGAAQNFWHLFATRVGIGAGESGCVPTAQSLICDYVPLRKRAGVFAIHNFGNYAGMMVGLVVAGWLGEVIGWRMTFVVLGLPGIALALIVKLTLREPVRGTLDAVTPLPANSPSVRSPRRVGSQPLGQALSILWNCRTYRLLTMLYALNGFAQYGLTQWWPSFYVRSFEASLSSLGIYLGLAIGLGSGIGSLIGGVLANKAARRDLKLPLTIGAVATFFALPTALGALFVPNVSLSIGLVALTAVFWSVSNGPIIAAVTGVVRASMRATAASVTVVCTSVLGFGLGPFSVGLLSDHLTPSLGVEALRYALLLPVIAFPLMSIVVYASARALPNDLRAIGAQA